MSEPKTSSLDASTFLQLQEEERQRLAQALMSGPGQVLANAVTEIEYSSPLLKKNPEVALAGLNALRDELRAGLAQLKEYVAELQPPLLEEMGLGPSILQYVRKFAERTGIRAECQGCENFNERYPTTIEITLFRVLQEALTNVATHALASQVRVELRHPQNQIQLIVQDNGRGFAPTSQILPKKRQLGLVAIRDRAELLGGQLQLFSAPGRGVRVLVTIPYHGPSAESFQKGGSEDHERRDQNQSRARGANRQRAKGQAAKQRTTRRRQSLTPQKRERQA